MDEVIQDELIHFRFETDPMASSGNHSVCMCTCGLNGNVDRDINLQNFNSRILPTFGMVRFAVGLVRRRCCCGPATVGQTNVWYN